jgi:hypothetical protein
MSFHPTARHFGWLIVVKLLALVALWWCFVRDARVEVDVQAMSRQLAPNPVVQGAPRGQ